jgi:hypothetical protein
VVKSNVDSRKDSRPPGSRFNGAPMPFAMFFRGGYAMHQGYVPPYAASHGCIRLPREMAEVFFNAAPYGTPVIVKQEPFMRRVTAPALAPGPTAPAPVVFPPMFVPRSRPLPRRMFVLLHPLRFVRLTFVLRSLALVRFVRSRRHLFALFHPLLFSVHLFVLRFRPLLPFVLPLRRLFVLPPFVRSRLLLLVPRRSRLFPRLQVLDTAFLFGRRFRRPRRQLDDRCRRSSRGAPSPRGCSSGRLGRSEVASFPTPAASSAAASRAHARAGAGRSRPHPARC